MMRIRTQLVLLVLAVIAPVALLATLATVGLWEHQRDAYQALFLERANALRMAVDSELDGVLRGLHGLNASIAVEVDEVTAFSQSSERLLAYHPSVSVIGMLGTDGSPRAGLQRTPALAGAMPSAALVARIVETSQAAISDLSDSAEAGGTPLVYVAIPIDNDGGIRGVLYAGIESASWLAFLERFPVTQRATLTLRDGNGRIIARVPDNSSSVGNSSATANWKRVAGRDDGVLLEEAVGGERVYSAFSRSRASSWTVSTAIPQQVVDAALSRPTFWIVAGVIVAGGLATLFAYLLGRRITGALTSLAASVHSLTGGERRLPSDPLPIEEAERVRQALVVGSRLLATREASLNEALAREAHSRAAAEDASRAKDDLLAMLGHELRNPISAIKSAIAVIEMPDVKPEVAQRARQVVQRQVGHLTSIVNDRLDVARRDSGKLQPNTRPLDLATVARNVVETCNDTELPLAVGVAPLEVAAAPLSLPPLNVAVVEDNADNRHLVAAMLRMQGHRVTEAEDGMRGVEALLSGDVAIALIDIGLPGWDGYEVARRVRAAPAGVSLCLIALTGYGRDEDRIGALAAGFDTLLVKPFEIAAFEKAVSDWMARRAPARPAVGLETSAG